LLGGGLAEVQVDLVVGGVPRDDQSDVRHVQHTRVVGVGVSDIDCSELVSFEFERTALERLS
jgi:hypothetical protein